MYFCFTVPEGMNRPDLLSQSPGSVLVAWSEPTHPNGDLTEYVLQRRDWGASDVAMIKTFSPSVPKQYLDDSAQLRPSEVYEYRVGAVNVAGTGYSVWKSVRTKSSSKYNLYHVPL
jgi:hypothetical protein